MLYDSKHSLRNNLQKNWNISHHEAKRRLNVSIAVLEVNTNLVTPRRTYYM